MHVNLQENGEPSGDSGVATAAASDSNTASSFNVNLVVGGVVRPRLEPVGVGIVVREIVEARQKTMPLAILLLFPLTSWFAFLFLAFSQDSRDEGAKVHVETMTLQTVCTSGTRYWKRVLLQGEQHIVA